MSGRGGRLARAGFLLVLSLPLPATIAFERAAASGALPDARAARVHAPAAGATDVCETARTRLPTRR